MCVYRYDIIDTPEIQGPLGNTAYNYGQSWTLGGDTVLASGLLTLPTELWTEVTCSEDTTQRSLPSRTTNSSRYSAPFLCLSTLPSLSSLHSNQPHPPPTHVTVFPTPSFRSGQRFRTSPQTPDFPSLNLPPLFITQSDRP